MEPTATISKGESGASRAKYKRCAPQYIGVLIKIVVVNREILLVQAGSSGRRVHFRNCYHFILCRIKRCIVKDVLYIGHELGRARALCIRVHGNEQTGIGMT